MRWSIGIGPSICVILNMTHCSHLISSVFEWVMLHRQGMGVGVEWQTLRRAAGALGVTTSVGRCVVGPGWLVSRCRGVGWIPGYR